MVKKFFDKIRYFLIKLRSQFIQFRFWLWELRRLYILKEHDCDNCKYYGGVACEHVDEEGNCLGWERVNLSIIHNLIYRYRIKKVVKILRNKYGPLGKK